MFIFSGKVPTGPCITPARTGSIISIKKIVVNYTQGVDHTFPTQTVFVHAETNKTIGHNAKRTLRSGNFSFTYNNRNLDCIIVCDLSVVMFSQNNTPQKTRRGYSVLRTSTCDLSVTCMASPF